MLVFEFFETMPVNDGVQKHLTRYARFLAESIVILLVLVELQYIKFCYQQLIIV